MDTTAKDSLSLRSVPNPAQADQEKQPEKGLVLVLSAGVLGVLAVLAGTLSAITSIEAQASKNSVLPHKAHEIGMSAINHAIALLMSDLQGDNIIDPDSNKFSDHLGEAWHTEFEAQAADLSAGNFVDIDGGDPYLTNQDPTDLGWQPATYKHYYNWNSSGTATPSPYRILHDNHPQQQLQQQDFNTESIRLYDGDDNAAAYNIPAAWNQGNPMLGHDTLSRWFVMKDETGEPIGRYAVLVMDTQGRININDWAWDNIGRIGATEDRRVQQANNQAMPQAPHRMQFARMLSYIAPPHEYRHLNPAVAGTANDMGYNTGAISGAYMAMARAGGISFERNGKPPAGVDPVLEYMNSLYFAPWHVMDLHHPGQTAPTSWRSYYSDLTIQEQRSPIGARGIVTPFSYSIDRSDYNSRNFVSARGKIEMTAWHNPADPASGGMNAPNPGLLAAWSGWPNDEATKQFNWAWFKQNFSAFPHHWRSTAAGTGLLTDPLHTGVGSQNIVDEVPGGILNINSLENLLSWLQNDFAGANPFQPSITNRSPININTAPARVLAGILFRDTLDIALKNLSPPFYDTPDDLDGIPLAASVDANNQNWKKRSPFHANNSAQPGSVLKPYNYIDAWEAGTYIRYPWVDGTAGNTITYPGDAVETLNHETPVVDPSVVGDDLNELDYAQSPWYWGTFTGIPGFSMEGFEDMELVVKAIIQNRPYFRHEVSPGVWEPLWSQTFNSGAGGSLKEILLATWGKFDGNAFGDQLLNTSPQGIALLIDNCYGDTSDEYRAANIFMTDIDWDGVVPTIMNFPFPETQAGAGPLTYVQLPIPVASGGDYTPANSFSINMTPSGMTFTTEFCTNATIFEILVVAQVTDSGKDPDLAEDDIPLSEITYQAFVNRDPDMNGVQGMGPNGDALNQEYDMIHFSRYKKPNQEGINNFYKDMFVTYAGLPQPHSPMEESPVIP